jgi:glutaredoxin
MEVKIYSISDCRYCDTLKTVLIQSNIAFTEVRVCRLVEQECVGMSFSEYVELEPDIPLAKKCVFPQVYLDGKYIGNMQETLRYLHNETK